MINITTLSYLKVRWNQKADRENLRRANLLRVLIWPLDFTFFKFVKTDTVKSEQRWRGEGDGDVQLAAADWRRCAAASVGVVLHSPLGSHCSAPKLHQVWLLAFRVWSCPSIYRNCFLKPEPERGTVSDISFPFNKPQKEVWHQRFHWPSTSSKALLRMITGFF